jgi:hypothetical protein
MWPRSSLALSSGWRSACDVRRTGVQHIARTAGRYLGLCAASLVGGAVRRWGLHYRRVLVRGVYFVRKPSGDACAIGKRYLRRYPAGRYAGFILAQLAGAAAATVLFRRLVPSLPKDAASVVVSHSSQTEDNV